MRLLSICSLTLALSALLSAQETPVPTRDAQAVNILTRALAVGGNAAVGAIKDYVASGTVTYSQNPNVQGSEKDTVRISGRGTAELRIDADSSGRSSYVVNGPHATTRAPKGETEGQNIQSPMMTGNLVLPYRQLAEVLGNTQFSLMYNGLAQIDGRSVYEIDAQWIAFGQPTASFSAYHKIDFLIDSSTFQLYITRDIVPRNAAPRQIRYSDYRTVSGVLVPFSIAEEIGGERTSLIHLDSISFNVGLQDSTFNLDGVAQ